MIMACSQADFPLVYLPVLLLSLNRNILNNKGRPVLPRNLFKLCAALLLPVVLVGQVPAAVPKGPPAAKVVVADAQEKELAPVAWFSGTVISVEDARLAAEVEARLVRVVGVGTVVKKGDVVARLDDTLIKEELAESLADVEREQARVTFFTAEVKRLRRLARKNNAARNRLDQSISNRSVARSERRAAMARVNVNKERLSRTSLVAPFDGVITERLMQVGEWAKSGKSVVRLVDTSTLEVQSWVPASSLGFIRPGMELLLKSGEQKGTATVRTIVPVGDDRSRLYELRLLLKGAVWPAGQTLRVAIPSALSRKVIAVPRDALVLRREGTRVFRINSNNKAEMVGVRTGIASGIYIEVVGDIRAGDRVVTRGGERLRAGQTVVILPGINAGKH
ncbi:MAG: efflux RND transporter periplasmic adaptor subunit [Gammaproteobacteria bacterium]|nr:MAG: efflux RND transporter periplasmic adaptor subunit [Gammaproteobacteria bacterium]